MLTFQADPLAVPAGDLVDAQTNKRGISPTLKKQCTICGQRFDCAVYQGSLKGGAGNDDVRRDNVYKR